MLRNHVNFIVAVATAAADAVGNGGGSGDIVGVAVIA